LISAYMDIIFLRTGKLLINISVLSFIWLTSLQAQQPPAEQNAPEDSSILSGTILQDGVVSYPAEFFRRYQANTALEMVNRVPGFTLDDGGNKRGFGGAAGNVLINDRRPSAKQDAPSAILGRISADRVERVELLRVRVRDVDLQGQTAVVNIILKDDAPATGQWVANMRQNLDGHGFTPFASISLAGSKQGLEYRVGADARNSSYGDPGVTKSYNPDGVLTEIRDDDDAGKGPNYNLYLNASRWLGDTFFNLNSRAGIEDRDILLIASRIPQDPAAQPRKEYIETLRRNKRVELGIDAERVLQPDLLGKAIFLYSFLDQNPSTSQRNINAGGQQTRLQEQKDETETTEAIARLEFNWAGFENHAIRGDLEYALNILDNTQVFTDDLGGGPIIISIPNANVRVEEERWNFLLQDSWVLGNFVLDYGLGFERSTITQSGDTDLERSFKFLKPRAVLTYARDRSRQTRLSLEREVSQLRFSDFVSATVFEDGNVILGNPDLRPDSTWISELSHEWRTGGVGVIKLTAFHHWITDVLDRIPIGLTSDAPGNIGDGRRWGLILETTLPLDWTGLIDARLDFKARWQDSTVVDPVTAQKRVLSSSGGFRSDVVFRDENNHAYAVYYRQDFEAARVSWGMGLAKRAKRPVFKVNELDIFDDGFDLTAFIETTRWFGVNIKIEGQNLLNNIQNRDRTVYMGQRELSPITRRDIRIGDNGGRLFLIVSGTF